MGKTLDAWHALGALSWQSAGTQCVMQQIFCAVPDLKLLPFWDACAGQGGKTFWLLEHGIDVGLASDISPYRLHQLQASAQRLKHKVPVALMSATMPAFSAWQGNILLDVPCSGLGTLARRPEIRKRRNLATLSKLCELQKEMLKKAFSLLSVQGHVVYITCTLNPEENENLIQNFLQKEPCAKLCYAWQTPHEHPWLEGMFVSVVKKIG